MPEVTIDMEESQAGNPIERAVEVEIYKEPVFSKSKNDEQMMLVHMRVCNVEGQEEFKDRKLRRYCMLQGAGVDMTEQQLLKAFNIPYIATGEKKDRKLRFNTDDMMGKRAIAHCKAEEYNGNMQTGIEKITSLPVT